MQFVYVTEQNTNNFDFVYLLMSFQMVLSNSQMIKTVASDWPPLRDTEEPKVYVISTIYG